MGRERDTELAYSINDVPIRLTYERWFHITENHDDLASYYFEVLEAIESPEFIIRGNKGSLKAAKNMGKKKWFGSYLPGALERGWFCHNGLFFRFKAKGERNMETATVNSETIERYLELSSKITRLHVKNVWADYDKEADVLYLSFRKPQRAKKTVEMGDDVLIRSDGEEVVGITVLNAGSRGGLRAEDGGQRTED